MLELEVSYDIDKIEEYFDEDKLIDYISNILKGEKEDFEDKVYYVSLLLTNNDTIHEINKTYRNKDMPTDVISFAYNETENISAGMEIVGDIVISMDKVKEQAEAFGHSKEREFYYLLTHGMLHILGYDHMEDEEQKIMRYKEEKYIDYYGYKR